MVRIKIVGSEFPTYELYSVELVRAHTAPYLADTVQPSFVQCNYPGTGELNSVLVGLLAGPGSRRVGQGSL